MIAALRIARPAVELPDPTLTTCERIILATHPVELMIRATDAEGECEHGNLPFDRNPDCECWTRAQTAALLGQAPLDDGCPGLDRAAALDLPIPQIEVPRQAPPSTTVSTSSAVEIALPPNLEVPMDSTTLPTQEMHDWYLAEDGRTMTDVSREWGVSVSQAHRRFDALGLPKKPRGGTRREEAKVPVAETPAGVQAVELAGAVVALERELMAVRLRASKLEDAIAVLRDLAA